MAADIISGIGGAVDGEDCVSLWKTERISKPGMAICSASDGSVVRGPGIMDWRGVYTGFGHTPSRLAGDTYQFIGATSGGYGASSVANGAIGSQTDIRWDIEGGSFIEYINYFEAATGALTYGAATASDTSTRRLCSHRPAPPEISRPLESAGPSTAHSRSRSPIRSRRQRHCPRTFPWTHSGLRNSTPSWRHSQYRWRPRGVCLWRRFP